MDPRTLEQKVQALAGYPAVGAPLARRFGELLAQQEEWGLFRVNPLAFGEAHGLGRREALDLFVHAAKVGLFDFAYNQLCPMCGGVEFSHGTLSSVAPGAFHCTICSRDVEVQLDDRLEVSFTINPSVHALELDPYRDVPSYLRTFFSANYLRAPEVAAFVKQNTLGFALLQAEGRQELRIDGQPGERFALISISAHAKVIVKIEAGAPARAELAFLEHGAEVKELALGPGGATLVLANRRHGPVGVMLGRDMAAQVVAMNHQYPPRWRPFVTGKMLLNNQAFRELFRVQSLAPDLKLNLKSLTVLFTDLKGSTELYDRTGDLYAYQVVQEHFRVLAEAVRRHEGAIVKTMGDAIMATFSTSRDAVAAAAEMMREMEAVNARVKADGHETGLKVGLHEGSALAVNAESRLDYFGQTVNIAARVQALASSGEIWLTEPVLAAEGVQAALREAGYAPERKVVSLKGVGAPTPVFRCAG